MANSRSLRSAEQTVSMVGPDRSRCSDPIGALDSGSTARTTLGSGDSARRWTRSTSSISMRGGSCIGSPMYHERYAVWAQVGQSSVRSAWTRGGRPSPGSP
jgi:hypothetical protein